MEKIPEVDESDSENGVGIGQSYIRVSGVCENTYYSHEPTSAAMCPSWLTYENSSHSEDEKFDGMFSGRLSDIEADITIEEE